MTLINIQQLKEIGPEIRAMALTYGCINPRIFGSVASGSNMASSDIDIVIDALPGTSLLAIIRLEAALQERFQLPFQVLTAKSLPIAWRNKALATAVSI
ncbi:nucleotidyltransferase family protein [Comamonas sp. C11]|uniref:nucleotidyltransferase family protein n=1 Tax=Comamonas sp. C11 TaxID=2966554 RepID=UPI002112317E|nr:nucleotidyltransferase domain-containing protein [Comamonas sp. C11]UUC91572.1 nucleotidyltransferase [Comamonas sp. C11]